MGGGDLNTKKSWHPSTLKNQERVWKAEQAAAEEKKRIIELQREREQEHDRSQLNEMAQRNFGAGGGGAHQTADNRLHWMYDKPDKQVQHEDYLLGKEIRKTEQSGSSQLNAIPAVSRRVVGSSMTKTLDDTQVDLTRKMREDPLLLVKERERAARAALLNNPLQRKRLADLLRQEKEQNESKLRKNKTKKKSKKKDKDLDHMLAAKLNALGGEKGIDLSSLLNSNDSSSESSQSSDEKAKKKKKKKKEDKSKKKSSKSKRNESDSNSDSDDDDTKKTEIPTENRYKGKPSSKNYRNVKPSYDDGHSETSHTYYHHKNRESEDDYRSTIARSSNYKDSSSTGNRKDKVSDRKRRSDSYGSSDGEKHKKSKREYTERSKNDSYVRYKRDDSPDGRDRREGYKLGKQFENDHRERRQGMSEAERAAKLAEMAAAGQEREVERGRRVAKQRAEDAAAESSRGPRSMNNEARALPDSLESRIKSNRHYIQRDKTHMNQHFARR